MTKPFSTYELRRVVQARGTYILDASVKTSAPYGDNMNPVVRYYIARTAATQCRLSIKFYLHLTGAIPFWLRGVVHSLAEDGTRGNFELLCKVLRSHFRVRMATAPEAEEPAPERQRVGTPPPLGVDLDTWHLGGLVHSDWWLSLVDKKSVVIMLKFAVRALGVVAVQRLS